MPDASEFPALSRDLLQAKQPTAAEKEAAALAEAAEAARKKAEAARQREAAAAARKVEAAAEAKRKEKASTKIPVSACCCVLLLPSALSAALAAALSLPLSVCGGEEGRSSSRPLRKERGRAQAAIHTTCPWPPPQSEL